MRKKPLYISRLVDGVFTIYKLSDYSKEPIKKIEIGFAYEDMGNHTEKYKKALIKYDIKEGIKYNYTDESKSKFYCNLFVCLDKDLPSKVHDITEQYFNSAIQQRKEEREYQEYLNDKWERENSKKLTKEIIE